MPTVEITDKLVGMWFLALTDESDWLCGLTEIEPEQKYEIRYRFRYYKDDKSHDSEDEKNHYAATVSATRSYALAAVRKIAQTMAQVTTVGTLDEILMHDKDVSRFVRELQDKPWAFMRIERKPKP